jgi:HAD superfamily 5'-nucleotidase-like hydrolase
MSFVIVLFFAVKKLPDDVNKLGIFANDELSMADIDVYGYDYDYTLAAYKKTVVERMIHSLAKKAMVHDLRYPEEILKFQYDPDRTIRGLHYDVKNGLLLKLNSALQIQTDAVFRGRKQLKPEEVFKMYHSKKFTLEMLEPTSPMTTSSMVHLVDNFAKPVMCLLCDLIQFFVDNGIDYEPDSIYTDVRVCVFLLKVQVAAVARQRPVTTSRRLQMATCCVWSCCHKA